MADRLTYTVAEVAAAVGMSASSVYEHVRRGDIPNVGVGRAVRIPRVWLDKHFAEVGGVRESVTTVDAGTFQ